MREAIASGSLPPGTVLPPSRVLAAELKVSRSLVVGAYEQLLVEGYLEARQGSGTRVRAQGADGGQHAAKPGRTTFWPVPVGRDGSLPRSGLPDIWSAASGRPRTRWLSAAGSRKA